MLQRGAIAARRPTPRACCWRTSPRPPSTPPWRWTWCWACGSVSRPRGRPVLITHQLGLAAQVADRVAVMYAGRLVEIGPARRVLGDPRHPYTRALLAATPRPGAGLPSPWRGSPRPLAPAPPAAPSAPAAAWPSRSAPRPGPELVDGVACPVVTAAAAGLRKALRDGNGARRGIGESRTGRRRGSGGAAPAGRDRALRPHHGPGRRLAGGGGRGSAWPWWGLRVVARPPPLRRRGLPGPDGGRVRGRRRRAWGCCCKIRWPRSTPAGRWSR